MMKLITDNSSNLHLERLCLITDKEEYLKTKELLKSQHVNTMEEMIQAYTKEDYAKMHQALAKISDISSDIKLVNCQIRNVDSQLAQLSRELDESKVHAAIN